MVLQHQTTTRRPARIFATYLGLVGLTYLLGLAAVDLTAHGQIVSGWWPAAGAAVLAVLAVPRRFQVPAAAGVWLMTALSNELAGRPLDLSLAYGLSNGVEALIVAWLLTRDGRRPSFATVRDVERLVVAALAGAVAIGVLAGLSGALLADGDFVRTAVPLVASHGSAVLTIVPVALTGAGLRVPGVRWQRIMQPVALAAVQLYVFAPSQHLPLAFLPMPFLVWGTFQFATRFVAVELLSVAVVATMATTFGGGPFSGPAVSNAFGQVSSLQAFLLTYTVSVLVFSAARNEQAYLADRLAEREQLLRGGILDAQIGLVIMRETSDNTVQVVQSNMRAVALLAPSIPLIGPDDDLDAEGERVIQLATDGTPNPFVTAILSARSAPNGEWYDEFTVGDNNLRQVELFITRVPQPHGKALITAQVVDVTERHSADVAIRRALRDERRAAAHLREASKRQDDFVSAVSHELRTPITSIIGFVEVLRDEGGLGDDQLDYLDIVERNARRLNVLVEDYLALGAGRARSADPASSTDLARLCTETVEELTPFAADRGVDLTWTAHDGVFARIDHHDATRVLANLMTNAVKFTPSGGSVTVDVAIDGRGEHCVLTVTDTGVGIAPEQLERVFERFYRTERAEKHSVPGVGLGLALVRELVERSGGTVTMHSDGVHGTQAIVVLRLATPAAGPTQEPVPTA